MRGEKLSRTASAYQHRSPYGSNAPATNPAYTPSRISGHSLKQRPNQSSGRYYFEPDPPGVVPSPRESSPLQQRRTEAPRQKHSYV